MATDAPTTPIIFVNATPWIEPDGDMMFLDLAGRSYVMTRHNLLRLLEAGRRAIAKQDAARAPVRTLTDADRAARAVRS